MAPEIGRHQAKLYADSLEKTFGHRPVIFYTNGFDIWIWDDAQGFPPRRLFGYYSKDSLQHLANYQRKERKPLDTVELNGQIVDRLYQFEAIKRVAERFEGKHRKALVVQATGSGKTRVAIALADLLIRAGWVKRVLFLCDRRELRKQAKNAFNDFLPEPIRIITSRVRSNASERFAISTAIRSASPQPPSILLPKAHSGSLIAKANYRPQTMISNRQSRMAI
ncbi:MAG: DEAD/DEAH box helicase family protein [Bradyrhizobium sp.]|nr:DEAD/DEAH box helicase family protein [Bradyrhizobium sp.]